MITSSRPVNEGQISGRKALENSNSGEALSANHDAISVFKEKLFELLDKDGFSEEQLYNCDEMAPKL